MANENGKIRSAARIAGIPLWKVAAAIGISEPTLTRWLRFPLPKEKESLILSAIDSLAKEVG
jgi:lambda repressor-like predicted transcriptional regulator